MRDQQTFERKLKELVVAKEGKDPKKEWSNVSHVTRVTLGGHDTETLLSVVTNARQEVCGISATVGDWVRSFNDYPNESPMKKTIDSALTLSWSKLKPKRTSARLFRPYTSAW